MKISINKMVETCGWLNCHIIREGYWGANGEFNCRLCIKDFKKTVQDQSLKSPYGDGYDLKEGDFWLLFVEIVNLDKQPWQCIIDTELVILDADDFEYTVVSCNYINDYFDKNNIMKISSVTFQPKIKYKGAFAFFIPKDDEGVYYLKLKNGTIKEI